MLDILVRLKDLLLTLPYSKENGSHTHVMIRCPICGDSVKHHNSTHCYVNIEYGKPLSYYCFSNCNDGHWINSHFLNALGITDTALINEIRKYNRSFMDGNDLYESKFIIYGNKKSIIPEYDKTSDYLYKLDYINKRLGSDLKLHECKSLKIILSLNDFLYSNNFYPNMSNYMVKKLNEDYVGFLSSDNSYIIFRDITGKNNIRYINYPVFKNSGNWGSKLYIIPGEYDLMSNDIECNITEGVFDILSCFINLNNKNKMNVLYSAVNGAGFIGVIKKILHVGFINNLNINIYSDSDKSAEYYKSLKEINIFCKSLNLFYNIYPGEKDIGVPKDRIKITKSRF